ncbi:MAG: tyrosine--tRNA ligase [Deltaproteobacteria bacterium]|nr:MAG: tyrosine--tRNA ligase [Deltaproteobacteria bacterium]
MTVLAELDARGLLQDVSGRDELDALLASEPVPFYAGYDPTGTSLHVGSLVPIVVQWRLQQAGHKPIVLVGGATGMIGDPSGRSDERALLDRETIAANVDAIRAQLSKFLRFDDSPSGAIMVDNYDWFARIGFIDFLRDVGKHLTVNYMIAKDSVRSRLEDRDQGISFTEFSYMLLQAYDFVVLARRYGCRLQVGGSDQWGNITAGIELARKLGDVPKLFGLTAPLLVDADGNKMGKTAAGTRIWLDPARTSPYAFYQYWLNQDDRDVDRLLRMFSPRPLTEIADLVTEHARAPHERRAQRALAEDVTAFVHGADAARRAAAASAVMFGGSLDELTDADLDALRADVPATTVPRVELERGIPLVELLVRTGLASSKGAARRLVTGGGVYLNNRRVADPARTVGLTDLATETTLILRAGKKTYHLVQAR